jgi:hypothetical protein
MALLRGVMSNSRRDFFSYFGFPAFGGIGRLRA